MYSTKHGSCACFGYKSSKHKNTFEQRIKNIIENTILDTAILLFNDVKSNGIIIKHKKYINIQFKHN